MYTFEDRGGDSLTLRPEGTAPVCRAYIEHGMSNLPQPVRLYYCCPIFRYERPQAGRFRQHNQFGIEVIGDADPLADLEVVQLGWTFTRNLGLTNLTLAINSIGDKGCRPAYLKKLKDNPLRLLDCKQTGCQPFIRNAPPSTENLCLNCQRHWDALRGHLKQLGIPYRENHRLVRGLDYYTRTVFEIQPPEEGSQNTVLGGGRYDGLIEQLGGPATPGVGFGSGIERLIANLKRQGVALPDRSPRPVVITGLGEGAQSKGVEIAAALREAGVSVLIASSNRSLRAQMRYASTMNASFTVIIGEDELVRGKLGVRDMDNSVQREVPMLEIVDYLTKAATT
ncbi:Histidine--tRNA ligase [Geodia barretti]|uniref:histidine--tRNA ligase n=1 Tax=Geodia barretti TaxID=519541 RepID=A0AA35X4U7_GEOBA|nr:Histidine--tRNA ligase [Geodia barretti]